MDKESCRKLGSRKALTQIQAILIIAIIAVVAISSAVAYYYITQPTPTPFSMQVIPDHIEDSVAGQRCVLLVTVKDEGQGTSKAKAATISATAQAPK